MKDVYISASSPWQAILKELIDAGFHWATLRHSSPGRIELAFGGDNGQPIDVGSVCAPKEVHAFIGFLATLFLKEKHAHEGFNVLIRMLEEGLIKQVAFDLRRIYISMS
jgi:hypothetical protein